MKGAYSSADELGMANLQRILYSDCLYRHDSGGNPEHIPSLTYEYFKSAHEKYYHPSGAKIILDGKMNLVYRSVMYRQGVFRGMGISSFCRVLPAFVRPSTGFTASLGIIQSRPKRTAPSILPSAQRSWTRRTPIPHFFATSSIFKYSMTSIPSVRQRPHCSSRRTFNDRLAEIYYTLYPVVCQEAR